MSGFTAKFSNILIDWNEKKIKRVVTIIAVLQVILFSYLYVVNRNPLAPVTNTIGGTDPRYMFSIYGPDEKSALKKPMAVAVSGNRIFVSDTGNQRVEVFDYDGNFLYNFGKYGTDKGQFRFPYGVTVDSKNRVYVADLYNGNISVFSENGDFLNYFGNSVDIKQPAGLFIRGDKMYVSDLALNKVSVFSVDDGKKIFDFGKTGTQPGEFQSPNALWVADNRIFVSDTGNDRVMVFNMLGSFLMALSDSDGKGNSIFVNPRGVAVNARGIVYVVNNLTHQIFGFDEQTGDQKITFGAMGNEAEQFFLPNGLFIDDQGRIFITDTVNGRVNVYTD